MAKPRYSKAKLQERRREIEQQDAAERRAQKQRQVLLSQKFAFGESVASSTAKSTASSLTRERMAETRAVPSLKTSASQTGKALPKQYTGDMAEREKRAREVRHVAAPIANKMGYQLITNPDDFNTMGRKT